MSDIAATSLGLVEESTPGVTPASPVFELQNIRDLTLDGTLTTVENGDLRTDLNTTGITPTGQQVGGGFPFGYRFDGLKQPLRGVFGANYAAQPVREKTATTANIGAVVAATSVAVLAPAGVAENSGTLLNGHLALTSGFAGAGNNGVFAAGASTSTSWALPLPTAEATPPVGAAIRVVGYEFPTGGLSAVAGAAGYAGGLTSGTTDFTTLGVQPGDLWKLGSGAAAPTHRFAGTAANNDVVVIGAVSASRLDLLEVPAGWTPDAGTGQTIRVWFGDSLTNSVVKKTFTAEEADTDIGPEYTYRRGLLPNSVAMSAPEGAEITGTVGFLGMTEAAPTLSRLGGATSKAAASGQVLNGANTLSQLRIDGAVASGSTFVTQVDMTFERFEAERRGGLFVLGAADVSLKRFRVTGSFQMYYEATRGRAVKAKGNSGAAFPISCLLVDPLGPSGTRAEGVYIPQAQYSATPKQNRNGSRAMNAAWTSKGDGPLGFAARWTRFWYIEL